MMPDKRVRANTIALTTIKILAFSTLFILVFLIGYLTFRGLVKEDVSISSYSETKNQAIAIYSGDSNIKRLTWDQARTILDGRLFSMRTISGYDDDILLYVDKAALPMLSSVFSLSEEAIVESAKIVTDADANLKHPKGSLYLTLASSAKPRHFSKVSLLSTVIAVNEKVTALVDNKKVGIIDFENLKELEDGTIINWSSLNGANLTVQRCTSLDEVSQTDGGYFLTTADKVYGLKGVDLLSIRSSHLTNNLTFRFLSAPAIQGGKYGGIGSIILNTFFMIILSIVFSAPVGLGAAIYLSLYAHKGKLLFLIQSGIDLLASVPSIIFGLFGLLVFVQTFGWSFSLISGSLTIALMICPTIIRTSQEAIKSVDKSLFDGSIALGATKIETILKISIPNAREGIIGGIILAIGRAAGETAALIYTIGSGTEIAKGLLSPARSLAMHIYLTVSEGRGLDGAFAASLVLMVIVLLTNRIARMFSKKELQ